jgi:hypothetical protein
MALQLKPVSQIGPIGKWDIGIAVGVLIAAVVNVVYEVLKARGMGEER